MAKATTIVKDLGTTTVKENGTVTAAVVQEDGLAEIIEVKQLPIIVEQLAAISAIMKEQYEKALSLEASEQTLSAVKSARAKNTKMFNMLEDRRKLAKTQVMRPYMEFEEHYKELITAPYKEADAELKARIDEIGDAVKARRREVIRAYFVGRADMCGVGFLDFDKANIKITAAASDKAMREQCDRYIDKAIEDVELIGEQDYADEIMYEYRGSLDAGRSIAAVLARHRALDNAELKNPSSVTADAVPPSPRGRLAVDEAAANMAAASGDDVPAANPSSVAPTARHLPPGEGSVIQASFKVRGERGDVMRFCREVQKLCGECGVEIVK